jgi:hypothetical protein
MAPQRDIITVRCVCTVCHFGMEQDFNGLSKHKLFASSYEELTRERVRALFEPSLSKRRAAKKTVKIEEVPKEPVIVAKVTRKSSMIATTSVRDALRAK